MLTDKEMLGNMLTDKDVIRTDDGVIELVMELSEQAKEQQDMIFNVTLSFNSFWNTRVLPKWTKI